MDRHAENRWPVSTGCLVRRMKPPAYLYVVAVHLTLVLATGVPLVLSWTVPLAVLPIRRCTFLWLTGIPCPFCGVTRAFWLTGQGAVAAAWYECPMGVLVYGAVMLVFAVSLTGLLCGRILLPGSLFDGLRRHKKTVWLAIGICILLNWIYRLAAGLH